MGLPEKNRPFKTISFILYALFVFNTHYSISYYTPYHWFPIDKRDHKKICYTKNMNMLHKTDESLYPFTMKPMYIVN